MNWPLRDKKPESLFSDRPEHIDGLSRREFLKLAATGSMAASSGILSSFLATDSVGAQETSGASTKGANAISLPSGGGSIRGIGESFKPDLFTGSGNFSVPIATTPGRSGFGPQLTLQYSTGNRSSIFGLGWQIDLPCITRKTEKGLPTYEEGKDVFVLSGSEDLVPVMDSNGAPVVLTRGRYSIGRFRPRTEGLFARIERWTRDDGDIHWRVITKDNITNLYGKTEHARISDPNKPHDKRLVFQWLLEETFDTKGNHILYEYVVDAGDRISTEGKTLAHFTQTYLRRILYGNVPEALAADKRKGPKRFRLDPYDEAIQRDRQYLFEVLFDYGDIPKTPSISFTWPKEPELAPGSNWPVRGDVFSSHRSRFDVRTRYKVQRVLILHHFVEGELIDAPLVKSTDFEYSIDEQTKLSLLKTVTVRGYRRSKAPGTEYVSSSLPSVQFNYSSFLPTKQRFQPLVTNSDTEQPWPLNDPKTAIIDLFGDGLPDIVDSNSGHYWQNLGEGSFVRRELRGFPAGVQFGQPGITIGDLGGDGLPDIIAFRGAASGFYEATANGSWRDFRPFRSLPTFSIDDPNVRLVDLSGDGLPDILRTEERAFVILPCLGEKGYGEPVFVPREHDLDLFPDIYFNDPRIHLADMNGDGLQDIVLVHQGRIDFWPSYGMGRFGPCITMTNSPRFGPSFDLKRVLFADLTGSGCADLVYVDDNENKVDFWFNQGGNGWSDRQTISGVPRVGDASSIQFADILGTGTVALVFSSSISKHGSNYQLLDFCGGVKPFLLNQMSNGMGATTIVKYGVSTTHAVRDRRAGRAWVTSLPFPVQVVDTVEVIDHIGRTKLVTEYKYHDGYYSGREREYRGFSCVEQIDSQQFSIFAKSSQHESLPELQNVNECLHVPPARTVTWFHTGLYFDEHNIACDGSPFDAKDLSAALQRQFYHGDDQAFTLADHEVETGDTPHDAYRALRGSILRTELYSDDGSAKRIHPYLVTDNRFRAKRIQSPSGVIHPSVYLTLKKETVAYHYERNPEDPRIAHDFVLEHDEYGNVLDTASIAYPRRPAKAAYPEQQSIHATYSINQYVNQPENDLAYFIGVLCETLRYEIHGLNWKWPNDKDIPVQPVSAYDLKDIRDRANALDYADTPTNAFSKRMIAWTRIYFRSDANPEKIDPIDSLDHRLELRVMQSIGLPYETYKVAFSRKLRENVFENRLDGLDPLKDGGYYPHPNVQDKESGAEGYWWVPSGRQSFDPSQFFQPLSIQDAFGNQTKIVRDAYGLLSTHIVDVIGNETSAQNDYRVLQPSLVIDPNKNRSAVKFDALGMVVATALMGKSTENLGDSLDGVEADLGQAQIDGFLNASDPHVIARELLGSATTRIIYDLHRFERTQQKFPIEPSKLLPVCISTLARETHVSDPLPPSSLKVQISFSYSDGFGGREIQKKIQAEPGPLVEGGIVLNPRWVATGWKIFTNKGSKPVRQYEPFFSATHQYEFDVKVGVSPIFLYDPLDRVVATFHPNHTWEKVVFNPWRQETWDVNDTVTVDPRIDEDVKGFLIQSDGTSRLPEDEYMPTWHALRTDSAYSAMANQYWPDPMIRNAERDVAEKTAVHAKTPTVVHIDPQGRAFLTIAFNRFKYSNLSTGDPPIEELHRNRLVLDITGKQREVIDAMDRVVMYYDYDLLGNCIQQASMESGERWMLNDVSGKPTYAWDSRNHRFRIAYDSLGRPTDSSMSEGSGIELLIGRIVYGETRSNPEANNMRGKVAQLFDQAGVVNCDEYDFKGNLKSYRRQLAQSYKTIVDWSSVVQLEADSYTSLTRYDALNRPAELTAPDKSIIRPVYNGSMLLKQVEANLRGEKQNGNLVWKTFIKNIDYDARRNRKSIDYGNSVRTSYDYDPLTFRLTHMVTQRNRADFVSDCPQPTKAEWPGCQIQNLFYTYDPVGNITHIRDDSQQTIYFRNRRVEPSADYRYDAVYRLIEARGREHLGQIPHVPIPYSYNDMPRIALLHPCDGNAMGTYIERYVYDVVGNFVAMEHHGTNPDNPGWKRIYAYNEASQLELNRQNNQLTSTTVGETSEIYSTGGAGYDAHGNILHMPHLQTIQWNFRDQIQMIQRQRVNDQDEDGIQHEGEKTWYVYDASGQRSRKITENGSGLKIRERIYLGGFEVYREYNGNASLKLERETLHIMDSKQRIALVETRTQGNDGSSTLLIRYQIGNHLGSISLELDNQAQIVSYEEFTPYGCSSVQAMRSQTETPKRYRYSKERDAESGLEYYGARYYAPYLGTWINADPAGIVDGLNLYVFTRNNPISSKDSLGLMTKPEGGTRNSETDLNQANAYRKGGAPERLVGDPDVQNLEPGFQPIPIEVIREDLLADWQNLTPEEFEILCDMGMYGGLPESDPGHARDAIVTTPEALKAWEEAESFVAQPRQSDESPLIFGSPKFKLQFGYELPQYKLMVGAELQLPSSSGYGKFGITAGANLLGNANVKAQNEVNGTLLDKLLGSASIELRAGVQGYSRLKPYGEILLGSFVRSHLRFAEGEEPTASLETKRLSFGAGLIGGTVEWSQDERLILKPFVLGVEFPISINPASTQRKLVERMIEIKNEMTYAPFSSWSFVY